MNRSDVLIVGGGVIGVACALELGRRGARVTLVERGAIGHGCSYGNAGWLTPSLATPLPAPGMLLQCLRWMLDPDSPLYIKPQPSPTLVRWIGRFLLSMNRAHFERSTEALVRLSQWSLESFRALSRELPDFGFTERGLLMIGETEAGVAAAEEEKHLAARYGIPGRSMGAEEIHSFEPAIRGAVRGGVYFPAEAHVEPFAVVSALAAAASAAGARLVPGAEVYDFSVSGGRIEGARTTKGWFRAERYLLATGSWSMGLARGLNLRLPVLGGKGYAVVTKPPEPMPRVPIKVTERRIAITPRQDSLRIAGTLELVDGDDRITSRRVDALVRGARTILGLESVPEIIEVWRGLRPCTPDGLPVIGAPKAYSNLLLVTGHQMLGLHTAPATARLAADLLLGSPPTFDPLPFRPDRF